MLALAEIEPASTLLLSHLTPQKASRGSQDSRSHRSPLPSPSRSPLESPRLHQPDSINQLLPLATMALSNPYSTLSPFLALLTPKLFLEPLAASLRPPWDEYFMLLASLASLRSNCMKRRVGAVLVREKRVVSTGYNGTPRGVKNCNEGGCGRCNGYGNGLDNSHESEGETRTLAIMGEGLDECLCLHAEENALLEAGRERVSGGGTEGAVLYCNTSVFRPLLV